MQWLLQHEETKKSDREELFADYKNLLILYYLQCVIQFRSILLRGTYSGFLRWMRKDELIS